MMMCCLWCLSCVYQSSYHHLVIIYCLQLFHKPVICHVYPFMDAIAIILSTSYNLISWCNLQTFLNLCRCWWVQWNPSKLGQWCMYFVGRCIYWTKKKMPQQGKLFAHIHTTWEQYASFRDPYGRFITRAPKADFPLQSWMLVIIRSYNMKTSNLLNKWTVWEVMGQLELGNTFQVQAPDCISQRCTWTSSISRSAVLSTPRGNFVLP